MRAAKIFAALSLAGLVLTGCYQNGRPGYDSDRHHHHRGDHDRDHDHNDGDHHPR